MSKLLLTQAAEINRSYLYKKYINTGIISIEVIDSKKFIDVSEIIRVFGNVLQDAQKKTKLLPILY